MTTAEIVSIIALCTSAITAISSAVIPSVLSYKVKKAELEEHRKRDREQKYELKFQEFYLSHLKVVTDFSDLYVQWKNNTCNATQAELVDFVSKLSKQFRDYIQDALSDFSTKIKNFKTGDNLDEDYSACLNLILQSYGVRVTLRTPNILLSDMLKVALRERFNELQTATSAEMHFYNH